MAAKATSRRSGIRKQRPQDPSKRAVQSLPVLQKADLCFIADTEPGITRKKAGSGFRYYRPDGKLLRDPATLKRIKSLAVPPAYTDVWISPLPDSHLQATGRDARGRKQYRYHPQWRLWRDANKYHRVLAFGKALPKIRRQVQKDLKRPGLCREKVLATIVRLLEATLIRVGNDEYARSNHSFGLTTLRSRHASIRGRRVLFRFRGKSGKTHEVELNDKELSAIVKRCRDLPGQQLFQYIDDDGNRHSVHSQDVNDYLREITQDDFTAKDFRTWAGTVLTATALHEIDTFTSRRQAQKNVLRAIESVSCLLGNTPAICRRCYVHPEVIEAYLDRTLSEQLQRSHTPAKRSANGLRQYEMAVMSLLRSRQPKVRKRS